MASIYQGRTRFRRVHWLAGGNSVVARRAVAKMAANVARQAECRGADISGAGTTRRYIDGKSIRSWRYDGKRTMEFPSKRGNRIGIIHGRRGVNL